MCAIQRIRYTTLLAVIIVSAWATHAWAQAWVADPNSLDLDFGYQYVDNNGHYGGALKGGYELQAEDMDVSKNHSLRFGAEYSTPVKGLAVGVSAIVLNTTFSGDASYFPHGHEHTCTGTPPNLTCNYADSGTKLTDGTIDVRYQLPFAPADLAITPLVGGTVPLTDYPVSGHAAYGKHRWEARAGIEIGRSFFDKAYADVLYTYSILQKVDDCVIAPPTSPIAGMCVPTTSDIAQELSGNRSDARLILGYFIIPQLSVYGLGSWRYSHGGFSWGEAQRIRAKQMAGEMLTPEEMTKMTFHDQLARERSVMVGGGLNYQPIEQLGINTGVYKVVWGDSVANSFAGGVNLTYTAF